MRIKIVTKVVERVLDCRVRAVCISEMSAQTAALSGKPINLAVIAEVKLYAITFLPKAPNANGILYISYLDR